MRNDTRGLAREKKKERKKKKRQGETEILA
jgi:hypothetical protein